MATTSASQGVDGRVSAEPLLGSLSIYTGGVVNTDLKVCLFQRVTSSLHWKHCLCLVFSNMKRLVSCMVAIEISIWLPRYFVCPVQQRIQFCQFWHKYSCISGMVHAYFCSLLLVTFFTVLQRVDAPVIMILERFLCGTCRTEKMPLWCPIWFWAFSA